jgi:hypothetical protein
MQPQNPGMTLRKARVKAPLSHSLPATPSLRKDSQASKREPQFPHAAEAGSASARRCQDGESTATSTRALNGEENNAPGAGGLNVLAGKGDGAGLLIQAKNRDGVGKLVAHVEELSRWIPVE